MNKQDLINLRESIKLVSTEDLKYELIKYKDKRKAERYRQQDDPIRRRILVGEKVHPSYEGDLRYIVDQINILRIMSIAVSVIRQEMKQRTEVIIQS